MSEILIRRFEAELAPADGRTIVGRAVPFDVAAQVSDPPAYHPYRELYRMGAFRRSVRSPHRVLLNYEHRDGLGDVIGHAVELTERADGLWCKFRALTGAAGDTALELIAADALTGLSVGVVPDRRQTRTLEDGTVERSGVQLIHVALTGRPSFAEAQVAGIRSAARAAPSSPERVLDELETLRASWADR
jgi:HK97 family phage prohead protease